MGIRAKQVDTGTFGATTAGRAPFGASLFDATLAGTVFAAGAIPSAKLADGANFLKRDGSVIPTANLPMGSFKLTGLAAGVGANDAVNKGQLDSAITGIKWKDTVKVVGFFGEATVVVINGLTPALGDAVVATTAATPTAGSSDALAIGDLAEFDGTSWKLLYANVAGRLPNGLRLIVSTTATLLSPLTSSADEGKVLLSVADPGTINGSVSDFSNTLEAIDGNAVLVQCPPGDTAPSVFENIGYVFDGAVPTGFWIQFTGVGQINAGAGLSKTTNTINVGDINRGVQANANDLQVDASEIAGNGLAQTAGGGNEHLLRILPDTTATDDSAAVVVASTGLSINGDVVSVDQVPSNYTRSISGTGVDIKDLASHLLGIDNALASAGGTPNQELVTTQNITGTDTALTDTLNNVPVSATSLKLFLNGILLLQGAGNDYSVSGQTITWLANTGTAPDLDTSDELIAVYES